MENTGSYFVLYPSLKWFILLLQSVLWCGLVIRLYKWMETRNSGKAFTPGIPLVKIRFFNFFGHVLTLPSSSVMKKVSLSLTAAGLQAICGHAAIFQKEPLFLNISGFQHYVILVKPESVEELLKSNTLLEKGSMYHLLHRWLGTGLLTSHGSKWKSRRKLLTHSFHFDILKDFAPIFDEQSKVLVNILKESVNEEWINIINPITLCSLDIISETTLGTHVGAQRNHESDYVAAVLMASKIVMERLANPIYHPDIIFRWSKLGRKFQKNVECLHRFTRKVIQEKKEALKSKESHLPNNQSSESFDDYKRKRKALIDLLLDIHMNDPNFTEEDIREEVDTFAFEGHDTTAMGMCWALYLIGLHPDVQRMIQNELDAIYADDPQRSITTDDLQKMQYLECVLKESQRLYPSVPFFGRNIPEDTELCGYKIKKGTTVAVVSYILHRNSEVFPNPETFDPDRFLPENCFGRNPFAYVPFSAGPRNCIGQRFAMLEEKTVISNVLRTFNVKSLDHRDKIIPASELILRPNHPLRLKFTLRKFPSEIS